MAKTGVNIVKNKKQMQRARLCVLCIIFILGAAKILFVETGEKIPILMYHHIDEDASNSMVVTPERFQADMEYLKENGYTAILPSELALLREKKQKLPEKPVMITFDDGYQSNYKYAYPVLQQTGMKAAIALICGNITDEKKDDALFLNWDECKEMAQSGIVEIGCHTYALHNEDNGGMPHEDGQDGVQRKQGETKKAYTERVGGDLHKAVSLIREKVETECIYFTYPFGAGDRWFNEILKSENIKVAAFTNPEMANLRKGLCNLPRYAVDMQTSLADILEQ